MKNRIPHSQVHSISKKEYVIQIDIFEEKYYSGKILGNSPLLELKQFITSYAVKSLVHLFLDKDIDAVYNCRRQTRHAAAVHADDHEVRGMHAHAMSINIEIYMEHAH